MVSIRGIIRPIAHGATALGWSPNRIMGFLRKNLGAELDERYALEEIRKAQQNEIDFSAIRNLRRDARPSERMFKLVRPPWSERYEYKVRMEVTDDYGNKLGDRYVHYRSNSRLSREELLEALQDRYRPDGGEDGSRFNVDDVLIVEAYQNANLV